MAFFRSTIQDLSFTIPDSGEIFKNTSTPSSIWKRLIADLFQFVDDGSPKFKEYFNAAKTYNDFDFGNILNLWTTHLGGIKRATNIELFRPGAIETISDVIVLTPHPQNPNSAVLTSSTFGVLMPGISLAQVATNLGTTEEKLLQAQKGTEPTPATKPISPIIEIRTKLAEKKAALKEPGRFDYIKMQKYPHLTKQEAAVWEKFITKFPNAYHFVDYDEVVGKGRVEI